MNLTDLLLEIETYLKGRGHPYPNVRVVDYSKGVGQIQAQLWLLLGFDYSFPIWGNSRHSVITYKGIRLAWNSREERKQLLSELGVNDFTI